VASSYGAAGGLLVILLWVYYSSEIFLLGAEFTRAWSIRHGSRADLAPLRQPALAAENAEPIAAASRREDPGTVGLLLLLAGVWASVALSALTRPSAARKLPRQPHRRAAMRR
jgi:membrane protein